jgi:alpha-beta hydrolase superfamily lysophospholipase
LSADGHVRGRVGAQVCVFDNRGIGRSYTPEDPQVMSVRAFVRARAHARARVERERDRGQDRKREKKRER